MVDNSLGRLINDSFSEMNIDSDLNYFINSYNNKFIIEDIKKTKSK